MDRLMEIRGAQQHAEPVAEPESAEQVDCQPNTQEATITHESAEDTNGEQTQPLMSPQTEARAMLVSNDPVEPEPITQTNDDTTAPPTQGEGQQPSNVAAENITRN